MSRGAQFSEDQISEFQEAFLLYDQRGDGKIPVSVIGDVMRALGQNPTESEVKKLVVEHRAMIESPLRHSFPLCRLFVQEVPMIQVKILLKALDILTRMVTEPYPVLS